jgi:hypothetical protein
VQSSAIQAKNQYQLRCPQLPLAVYREVAAHLRQVEGVKAVLIPRSISHDQREKFDYNQSQILALEIEYSAISDRQKQQIEDILDYYAQRYRPWEFQSDK